MPKYVRAAIVGAIVGAVVAFFFAFLDAAAGKPGSWDATLFGLLAAFFTTFIMANLAGNRAARSASSGEKDQALNAQPPSGKALLYLYREGFVAKLVGLNVSVDGREVAQLKSPRFTCVTVAPGTHTVAAAFGGAVGPQSRSAELTVDTPPGSVIALRMTMRMGALKGSVDIAQQADLHSVKRTLSGMPMVQPDLAEVV
jgi:hypothetical protein